MSNQISIEDIVDETMEQLQELFEVELESLSVNTENYEPLPDFWSTVKIRDRKKELIKAEFCFIMPYIVASRLKGLAPEVVEELKAVDKQNFVDMCNAYYHEKKSGQNWFEQTALEREKGLLDAYVSHEMACETIYSEAFAEEKRNVFDEKMMEYGMELPPVHLYISATFEEGNIVFNGRVSYSRDPFFEMAVADQEFFAKTYSIESLSENSPSDIVNDFENTVFPLAVKSVAGPTI